MKKISLLILSCMMAFTAKAAMLDKTDLEDAIKTEFVEQNIAEDVEVEIFGGKSSFEDKNADELKVMLSGLKADAEQGRFTITAEIFADGEIKETSKIIGRYFVLEPVWVLSHELKKGDVIKNNDLKTIKVRSNRLRNDSLWQKEDLLDKQAARGLRAGKVLEKNDVQEVNVIKKGQTVTAVYTKKGLQITSKMQALEDASAGGTVKLLNLTSKKEITGVAKDANTVEIISE